MKKKTNRDHYIFWAFILLFILGSTAYSMRKDWVWENHTRRFTVGRIESRLRPENGLPYTYYVDGIAYKGSAIPPDILRGKFRIQAKFIVEYVTKYPDNSRLLWEYKSFSKYYPSAESWSTVPLSILDSTWHYTDKH